MPNDAKELPDAIDVFPSDQTKKVYFSKALWVEFKTELTYGERKTVDLAMFTGVGSDGKATFDLAHVQSLKMALFVADWNALNRAGKPFVLPQNVTQRTEFFGAISEKLGALIMAEIERIESGRITSETEDDSGNGEAASATEAPPNGSAPAIALTSTSVAGPVGAGTN